MLPFCGYNMADYFAHWLEIGDADADKLPKIFFVNWFRKDADGRFLWPGFGENSRVLKWVFERVDGGGEAVETAIGLLPAEAPSTRPASMSSPTDMELLRVDGGWRRRSHRRPTTSASSSPSASPTQLDDRLDHKRPRLAYQSTPAGPRPPPACHAIQTSRPEVRPVGVAPQARPTTASCRLGVRRSSGRL